MSTDYPKYHVHERTRDGNKSFRLCTGRLPCSEPGYRSLGNFGSIDAVYNFLDTLNNDASYDIEYPRPLPKGASESAYSAYLNRKEHAFDPAHPCSEFLQLSGAGTTYFCLDRGDHKTHETIVHGIRIKWVK